MFRESYISWPSDWLLGFGQIFVYIWVEGTLLTATFQLFHSSFINDKYVS